MSKVYVVTAGTYSDYRIITVFGSEETADQFAAADSDYRVEEYDLDLYAPQVREGLKCYHVSMPRNGNGDAWISDPGTSLYLQVLKQPHQSRLFGDVWAQDKQHALKIANEKRAQLIATGEWPEVD